MPKRYSLLVLSLLLTILSGCASMFAPNDVAPPDVSKITIGMHRSEIERRLGTPVSDIRPELSTGGARKCEYRYMVRQQVAENASYMQIIANNMVGFESHVVTIIYDAAGLALKIEDKNIDLVRKQRSRTS